MMTRKLEDFHNYRIKDAPPHIYYVPDFINEDEEAIVLEKVPRSLYIFLTESAKARLRSRLIAGSRSPIAASRRFQVDSRQTTPSCLPRYHRGLPIRYVND